MASYTQDRPPEAANRADSALSPAVRLFGDAVGAFGDLGTFLPLVVAILATGAFAAGGILWGFGLFAIATGLVYRRPVPVQPMKAVSALIIIGQLTPGETAATGLLVGAALLTLGATGLISRLNRLIPLSVLPGIQAGLGLQLLLAGLKIPGAEAGYSVYAVLAVILAGLLAMRYFRFGFVLLPVLLGGGIGYSLVAGGSPPMSFAVALPAMLLPGADDFAAAVGTSLLPQLALTVTNAVLLTALIAADYFPQDKDRISPRRLSLTTGVLNLALAPFGALPMCHGAGGLPAQYRFGARTGLAPVIFGVACILLALLAGETAAQWMALVPAAVVAAMLAFAGIQLVNVKKLASVRTDCYPAIAAVTVISVAFGITWGLLAGLVIEFGRNALRGRIAAGTDD